MFYLQIAEEHGGIMRFIQVSGVGASPSRMLRAKAAAEEAIMRELPVRNVFYFLKMENPTALIMIGKSVD